MPIVSELDIHTKMSQRMAAMADALVVHQTFPEIDQEECGLKCASMTGRCARPAPDDGSASAAPGLGDEPQLVGAAPCAHIRQGGLHVLVVSRREQPYDPALARTLDLDGREMRYIG